MQQQQNSLSAKADAGVNAGQEMISDLRKGVDKLNIAIEGLRSGKNGAYYYSEKIPEASLKVVTNSDGKFKIELASEKRVAIVASKGGAYWFLWVSPKDVKVLNLTNTNLLDTNCEACIFNGVVTPQSL